MNNSLKKFNLILRGILSAIGVFVYTLAIAWLLFNGEKFFGKATSFLMPTALLLLFILSAAITGLSPHLIRI